MNGLLTSVRKVFDQGLAAVESRVELFGLELREEKWRFLETVVLVLGTFFLAMMAVIRHQANATTPPKSQRTRTIRL